MTRRALHAGGRCDHSAGVRRGRGRGNVAGDHLRRAAFAVIRRAASRPLVHAPGHDADVRRPPEERHRGDGVEERAAAGGDPQPERDIRLVRGDGLGGAGAEVSRFSSTGTPRRIATWCWNRRSFPCRAKGCRLLYDVLYTLHTVRLVRALLLDRAQGVGQGGRGGGPAGQGHGAGRGDLVFAGRAPRMRRWRFPIATGRVLTRAACGSGRARRRRRARRPATTGIADSTATRSFHAHRPARRPGRSGGLAHRAARRRPNTDGSWARTYPTNAMAFGLYEDGHAVPIGVGRRARQSLEEGYLPIVLTDWSHGDIAIRQRATAEPLRGTSYETGLESTLAWAESSTSPTTARGHARSPFSPPNRATTRHPKRNLSYPRRRGDGRRQCPLVRAGPARLQPGVPGRGAGDNKPDAKVDRSDPRTLLTRGRAVQCAADAAAASSPARPRRGGEPGLRFPRRRCIGAELPPRWRPRN